jgi:hypothetical protein
MYKQIQDPSTSLVVSNKILRTTDNAWIPFAPANTDYQQFKKDLDNGIQLQDANGNVMTQAQVTTFMETLP